MMKFFGKFSIDLGSEFAGYGLCSPKAFVGDYAGKLFLLHSCNLELYFTQTYDFSLSKLSDVAASVNDPIFFPHHTMVDRIFGSWRLHHPGGQWETMNFTFPSHNNSVYPDFFSDVNILNPSIMWPGVLPPGDGNPTGVCEGHGLHDPTLRSSFFDIFKSLPAGKPVTNYDLLTTVDIELFSPESADYVYDSYLGLE